MHFWQLDEKAIREDDPRPNFAQMFYSKRHNHVHFAGPRDVLVEHRASK